MISKNCHKLCPIKKREFREALHITSKRVTYEVQEKDIAFAVLYCREPCLMKKAAVKCLRLFRMSGFIQNELVSGCGRSWERGTKVERAVLFCFGRRLLIWRESAHVALFIRLSFGYISSHFLFIIIGTGILPIPCWCSQFFFSISFALSHLFECMCVAPVA